MNRQETKSCGVPGSPVFATTYWGLVLAAADTSAPESAAALERLCHTYWYPLYGYVRRRGHSPEDARDLTQEFFRQLLARNWLPQADRQRGRFRSFLLGTMKHFLNHEWERAKAVKRGGRILFQSLEGDTGFEQRFMLEAQLKHSPEHLYEYRWATTLLDSVLHRLRQDEAAQGRLDQFNALEHCLIGEKLAGGYAKIALQLGTTEAAIKMAVQRLRARYAAFLREEIALTVASPLEVEDEVHYLLSVLSR